MTEERTESDILRAVASALDAAAGAGLIVAALALLSAPPESALWHSEIDYVAALVALLSVACAALLHWRRKRGVPVVLTAGGAISVALLVYDRGLWWREDLTTIGVVAAFGLAFLFAALALRQGWPPARLIHLVVVILAALAAWFFAVEPSLPIFLLLLFALIGATRAKRDKDPDGLLKLIALWDGVAGGGLFVSAAVLAAVRSSPISHAQRMTISEVSYIAGIVIMIVAILGVVIMLLRPRGWIRIPVAVAGTLCAALIVFQIGLSARWNARSLLLLASVGAAVLAAGLLIPRRRRWGVSIQILLLVAAAVAASATNAGPLMVAALLVVLSAFVAQVFTPRFISDQAGRIVERVSRSTLALTLVLTVVIVVIVGVGASQIVVATERGLQKQSLAAIGQIGQAVEAYATAYGHYPAARDINDLARLVEPMFIKEVPRTDGWGYPIGYHRVVLPSGVEGHVIRSPGADGVFEQTDPTAYRNGETIGFERDIVRSTISGQQWPEGMMMW